MLGPRMKRSTSAEVRMQPHTDRVYDATSAGIVIHQNNAGLQYEVSDLVASRQLVLHCRDGIVSVPSPFHSGRKKRRRTMGTIATRTTGM